MAFVMIHNCKHQKEACSYDEIGRCAQNKDIILGLVDDTIGKACVITAKKRKKNLYFDLLTPSLTLNTTIFIIQKLKVGCDRL